MLSSSRYCTYIFSIHPSRNSSAILEGEVPLRRGKSAQKSFKWFSLDGGNSINCPTQEKRIFHFLPSSKLIEPIFHWTSLLVRLPSLARLKHLQAVQPAVILAVPFFSNVWAHISLLPPMRLESLPTVSISFIL